MNELKYLNIGLGLNQNHSKLSDLISFYTNKTFKYSSDYELIDLINSNNLDLIIINYNLELLEKIRQLNKQIQIIVFLDEINIDHLLIALKFQYVKFIEKVNCINEFIYILKDCVKCMDAKKSNILPLKNNFIYDRYNKTLFKGNEFISLSNKESLFLDLLISKSNRVLEYDQIKKEIWNSSISQDALRSLIKEIRKKTYKDLIKNISGIGYRIVL